MTKLWQQIGENNRKQQLQLENAYAQAMLHEDGIVETTTKRQWKNGTRQFKLPTGELLATYKSGYVRRCPKYKRKVRWVFLDGTELVTKEYTTWSRALIWSGLARLKFLHDYAKKNYLNK
jgi:hypothetical protein